MQRIILHLDMNSYFASVEQQANPFWRHRPVGICAYLSQNGCLIATSKEAKKFGVVTGLRVPEALRLCPDLILVENDPDKYRSVSKKVFSLMSEYGKTLEIYSIDEAFLDLTGIVPDFGAASQIAQEIANRIKTEIGEWLDCSRGLSFTRFLAKFASDTAGKGSLRLIPNPAALDAVYANVPVKEAWGIGPATAKKLCQAGLPTLLDLKQATSSKLLALLGKEGYFLWARVNGLLDEALAENAQVQPKSISHSYCLKKPTADKEELKSLLAKLGFKVITRLRQKVRVAYGFSLYWSYTGYAGPAKTGFSKSLTLARPLYLVNDLFQLIDRYLNQEVLAGKVAMVAISVFNLKPFSGQQEIFNSGSQNKKSVIEEAMAGLNNKYGSFTVYPGKMFTELNSAPDRIGFRKVDFDYQDGDDQDLA